MWFCADMMKPNNDKQYNRTNDMNEKDLTLDVENKQVRCKGLVNHTARAVAMLCAVSGLMVASAGQAAVYYVDVGSGSDSNNGTAQASAWAHLPGTTGFSGSGWVR